MPTFFRALIRDLVVVKHLLKNVIASRASALRGNPVVIILDCFGGEPPRNDGSVHTKIEWYGCKSTALLNERILRELSKTSLLNHGLQIGEAFFIHIADHFIEIQYHIHYFSHKIGLTFQTPNYFRAHA